MTFNGEKNLWFLEIASVVSKQSKCARRKVGCVLVDVQGHILSTGYNGPPRGFRHCTVMDPCDRTALNSQSGTNLELCNAVHAEQNALLQCPDVEKIHACFVTVSPCTHCVKLLLNTSCTQILFLNEYAHGAKSKELWTQGRDAQGWLLVQA